MSRRIQACDDDTTPIPTSVVGNKRKGKRGDGNGDEKPKLAHDEYTVGWVCILRCELNASRALLDEEHERLAKAERDDNSYLLGRMGKHNVVIAFPGSGNYGTNIASQTATNMLRTFCNIRFGLLVGVGGGAPKLPGLEDPSKDIRLGDVVVSTPQGSHGGVIQYDMGKQKNSGEFNIQSHLNKPPPILSKAIELLQCDHDFKEGEMQLYIEEVAVKSRKLPALKEYQFPGRDQDQLFRSNYRHAGGEDCSACDAKQVEDRLCRESDDPVIHYGLIASGNAVMRSAQHRDKLRDTWGVLCFEMEAAGLMDSFPCVVIRGICDYSDGHKHKAWQPYSAVVAAAYAKDLLRIVQLEEVEGIESASKVMEKLQEVQNQVQEGFAKTDSAVESLLGDKDRRRRNEILNWLTPIDYAPQHNDYRGRRQPGTGQWLLQSTEYKKWLEGEAQTLFCPGIPGAGKTTLTSIVIDDLCDRLSKDTRVVYIYCNFQRRKEQILEYILANLLKQLASGQSRLPPVLEELYSQYENRTTRPSLHEISKVLQSVAKQSMVFVVIDALDEYQETGGSRTRLLAELFSLRDKAGSSLFVTSRFIPEIEKGFTGCLSLEIRASQEDVWNYLQANMSQLPDFVTDDTSLQRDIKIQIEAAVEGMFLLAQLYLDSLVEKRSPKALRRALESIRMASNASQDGSSPLYDMYGTAMERIQRQRGDLPRDAILILSWIVFANQPLGAPQLQHALAVEIGTNALDEDNIPTVDYIVKACAPLLTVEQGSDIIRLVHYTTQEYLEKNQDKWLPSAEIDIAAICLTYLTFQNGYCRTDMEFWKRLRSYPLYKYSADNWGHHFRNALITDEGRAMSTQMMIAVLSFLESTANVEAASQALLVDNGFSGFNNALYREFYSQEFPTQITGLHLAAYFGVKEVVYRLLSDGRCADRKDSNGWAPLFWASRKGHETVVRLLLDYGALPDLKDKNGATPLAHAVECGSTEVTQLLLAKALMLDYNYFTETPRCNRTPLSRAAEKGDVGIVKLLLQYGANPNLEPHFDDDEEEDGWTPLSFAVEIGSSEVIQLLITAGATVDHEYFYTGILFGIWSSPDSSEQVQYFWQLPPVDGRVARTFLSRAAEKGDVTVVKLLLEHGAKPGLNIGEGWTPLSFAIEVGILKVVQLLLDSRVAVNYEYMVLGDDDDGYGNRSFDLWGKGSHRTPLSRAAEKGNGAIVKLLLEHGAQSDWEDKDGQTALSLAVLRGSEEVVELLQARLPHSRRKSKRQKRK